ncbi:MAG TPA: orotidine-5'-phosphate decarboxylase, partial [Blastocatellia bacterium]|nr:orotidine-5'-phosphate decarboxylase [Blastocatellia bacterium]
GSQGKAENGRPAVIAVTVLTSMNHDGLNEVGVGEGVQAAVVRLARLAKASGLDGVVASPREVRLIRENVSASNFLIVTPGVRPDGCLAEDQKRVATPTQAITDGADFIVVGRPITSDPNPRAAAERILEEISSATK